MIITNSRYALVGYFITSYPTRASGIIVIYFRAKWRLLFIYISSGTIKTFLPAYNRYVSYVVCHRQYSVEEKYRQYWPVPGSGSVRMIGKQRGTSDERGLVEELVPHHALLHCKLRSVTTHTRLHKLKETRVLLFAQNRCVTRTRWRQEFYFLHKIAV